MRPRDGQGARCLPRGAPGQRDLPRAPQGWARQVDPCRPQGLACLCARPRRIPAARRPLLVRSAGRGHSLAQVHSLPTCWPPTAHSGLELDRGFCDFQRNSKAPERPQLAPSLLLLPPSVCWPLAAQGSGLVLGAGELAAHAQGAWVTTKHPSPLSGTPNSLWWSGQRLDSAPAGPPARGAWSQGRLAALAGPDAHCMRTGPLWPGCRAGQREPGCCHLCPHRLLLPTLGPQQLRHQGYGLKAHPVPKGSTRFRDCDTKLCLGCASRGRRWAVVPSERYVETLAQYLQI